MATLKSDRTDRRDGKSAAAFRTITEVSEALDIPAHVLRFWETKFASIKPLKRGGGRRYYRPEDVELLRGIRGLLYDDGYTIRGVQKLLRQHSGKLPPTTEIVPDEAEREVGREPPRIGQYEFSLSSNEREELLEILADLRGMRDRLSSAATRRES